MNYAKILKRAWDILWNYKALWIFGFLLALTTNSGFNGGARGSSHSGTSSQNYGFEIPSEIQDAFDALSQYFHRVFSPENLPTFIGIGIAIIVFFILLAILFAILHYVSRTALIKMVDTYETSGEKVNWRQGFRLGWSRQAWQLFLINLVIFLPLFLIAVIFMGCAFVPVLLSLVNNNEPSVTGIIATVGMFFLIVFILVIVKVVLSLVMEIIYRECVLKGKGVINAIRDGWKKVFRNLKDIFLMWLILIGIQLGFFLICIPVALMLMFIALLVGGGTGVLIYFLVNTMSTVASWITAGVVGGSLFLIIFSLPMIFLNGLLQTYISSVWTLVFRELNGFELVQNTLPPFTESGKTGENEEIPTSI